MITCRSFFFFSTVVRLSLPQIFTQRNYNLWFHGIRIVTVEFWTILFRFFFISSSRCTHYYHQNSVCYSSDKEHSTFFLTVIRSRRNHKIHYFFSFSKFSNIQHTQWKSIYVFLIEVSLFNDETDYCTGKQLEILKLIMQLLVKVEQMKEKNINFPWTEIIFHQFKHNPFVTDSSWNRNCRKLSSFLMELLFSFVSTLFFFFFFLREKEVHRVSFVRFG